jgi:hypothetical protein
MREHLEQKKVFQCDKEALDQVLHTSLREWSEEYEEPTRNEDL